MNTVLPSTEVNEDLIPKTSSIFLSWLCTPLHVFIFVCILLVFHILLFVARSFISKKAFEKMHELHNLAHLLNMRLSGTKFSITGIPPQEVPAGGLLLVSNHQSMYDIPLLAWTLKHLHLRFIAKKELSKGIPSISYSLRHGEHALIDRQNPESAVASLRQYGGVAAKENRCVVLFPEGTRAWDARLKAFKSRGFRTLREEMPNAPVLAVALDGSSALLHYKFLPVPFGIHVRLHFFPLQSDNSADSEVILRNCEAQIAGQLEVWRSPQNANGSSEKLDESLKNFHTPASF